MSSEWKQNVVRNFDARAHEYDRYSSIQTLIAQSLVHDLPALVTPDVLEIGCGAGALTQHLLNAYADGHFYITDISPKMVEQARERIGDVQGVDWGVMDGENPANDQRYDLIVGNMVFQWFENTDEALAKLQSLLKPGGVIFYTVPAPTCFKEWRSVLSGLSLPDGVLEFSTLPGVLRNEEIMVEYESTLDFLQSMKRIGAHAPRGGYEKLNRTDLLRACHRADEEFQGKMTWDILYGRLTA